MSNSNSLQSLAPGSLAPSQAPPRGVAVAQLLALVRNTAPYLFSEGSVIRAPFVEKLRQAAARAAEPESHVEYFQLCVSAHYATCSAFVPTDVDNQIRFRLWHPSLDLDAVRAMAAIALEARAWPVTEVSARWVRGPASGELLSGHLGEWFSISVAAYGALRRRDPERAGRVASVIVEELWRHSSIYGELRKACDGLGLLRASALIAHNLGDLDRVIEAWNLPEDDALRVAAFKAGHAGSERFSGWLQEAGRMNQSLMAAENHRHFALRAPRCLRRNADLLLPLGPFFDDWGARLARHPDLSAEEVAQVVEVLISGWERLPGTVGYARALAGIQESFPGGMSRLMHYLTAKASRNLRTGLLRSLCAVPRLRFEDQWAQTALNLIRS